MVSGTGRETKLVGPPGVQKRNCIRNLLDVLPTLIKVAAEGAPKMAWQSFQTVRTLSYVRMLALNWSRVSVWILRFRRSHQRHHILADWGCEGKQR